MWNIDLDKTKILLREKEKILIKHITNNKNLEKLKYYWPKRELGLPTIWKRFIRKNKIQASFFDSCTLWTSAHIKYKYRSGNLITSFITYFEKESNMSLEMSKSQADDVILGNYSIICNFHFWYSFIQEDWFYIDLSRSKDVKLKWVF